MNFVKWIKKAKEEIKKANQKETRLSKFSTNVEDRALIESYVHYDLIRKTWYLAIATWSLAI